MARLGVLITGIVLLIFGVIGYQIPVTNTGYTIPGANNLCNTDLARLGQLFSGDLQQVCGQYQLMLYGIYGLAIIGIILIIVGATIPKSFQKSKSKYICGYCKYVAESERELHNHSLNCQEYEKETSDRIISSKYHQYSV